MRGNIGSLALLAGVGLCTAIYPEDHWNYATKLTNDDEFNALVAEAVDSDKTLFAPSWNEVVKTFSENDDVIFGDVVLSGGGPRGGATASPGAGGWPTIRYYNKGTGVDGHNYDKKTDMSMCDELGPKGGNYMLDYVLEAGGTSLCSIEAPYKGCKKKETDFIEKLATKDAAFIVAQLDRLVKMKEEGSKMKPELQEWQNQRIAILQKFAAKTSGADHAEL